MADAAKIQRATAKRLFTMATNQMSKAIDNGSSKEAVTSRFQNVYKCWADVMEKHATYLAHQYPDDGDPSEEDAQYLESIESVYDDAEKTCESYLKSHATKTVINTTTEEHCKVTSDDPTPIANEEKRVFRACKYEEAILEAVIENLHIVTSDDRASMQTIKDAQNELKAQLERYRTAQRDYVMMLSEDDTVENETKAMKDLQLKCAQANIEAGKEIEMRTLINTETKAKTGAAIELKLERMKMPTFSG